MMAYATIDSVNASSGLETIFCYVGNTVTDGLFMSLLLFVVWAVFALGSYFITKHATGLGDLPQSTAVAGFVTVVFAFIMRLVACGDGSRLVSSAQLVTCVVVAVVGVLWLFFSRD